MYSIWKIIIEVGERRTQLAVLILAKHNFCVREPCYNRFRYWWVDADWTIPLENLNTIQFHRVNSLDGIKSIDTFFYGKWIKVILAIELPVILTCN